jgi:hypothetical protein
MTLIFSKFQKSQSHDFDFFEKYKKVKVMTLIFSKFQKSQSHDFDLTFIKTFFSFLYFMVPKAINPAFVDSYPIFLKFWVSM